MESKDIRGQLSELAEYGFSFELTDPSRCSVCNGSLLKTDSEADDVPEDIEHAWRCEDCGKKYWKGSHWDDVGETFESL